jgi:hypothetical protein
VHGRINPAQAGIRQIPSSVCGSGSKDVTRVLSFPSSTINSKGGCRQKFAPNSGASPRSTNQPPVRIPETEAEIEQALEWLKSQGYLRPTVPAPPPVLPPREVAIPTVSKRAGAAPRHGTGMWLLLAALIGLPLLLARLSDNTQPQARSVEVRRALPVPVEVRRALPAVPRALPASAASTVSTAEWQPVRMPDSTIVQVSYQGELPSSAALPPRGRFIGEEWSTGNTSWIWIRPPERTSRRGSTRE